MSGPVMSVPAAPVPPAPQPVETGLPFLDFPAGLPGFPTARRFVLVRVGEAETLFLLRCVDDEAVRFVVVPPAPYFPDYAPTVPDDAVEALDLEDADDVLLLLVVTASAQAPATVNLLAPVVVNRRSRTAAQVVLSGSPYSLHEPLPGAS